MAAVRTVAPPHRTELGRASDVAESLHNHGALGELLSENDHVPLQLVAEQPGHDPLSSRMVHGNAKGPLERGPHLR